jgi:histone deacetylase 11
MKIMIVDLDAHQGNGHERDHMDDENTYILDAYNHNIYPGDRIAQKAIKYDISVMSLDQDDVYLSHIKAGLRKAINEF